MKTKIRIIICGFMLLLLGSACNDFLDVHPDGEILGDDLLTDEDGFEDALYGAYATMRGDTLYGRYMTYYVMDVLAQYFSCSYNTEITDLSSFKYTSNAEVKKDFLDIWRKMYENISYLNNVLINLGNYSPSSMRFYDIYKGEALGLRGYLHFDLLRLFCSQTEPNARGIVYSTQFSLIPSEVLTKEEVYRNIIRDLRGAEQLLDQPEIYAEATDNDDFLKDQSTHFNLQAVRATLARVYMTYEKTDSAYYYADKVIRESGLSLVDKTEVANDIIGTLSMKETIFGLYSQTTLYNSSKAYLYESTSYKSLDPRRDIESTYQQNGGGNDFRWAAWFTTRSNQLRFVKLTDKYQLDLTQKRPAGQIPGLNLIRLPEMYYIAAECLLKNDISAAEDYFNEVLESRGLTPIEEGTLTLDKISDERYKEFIGEGQSFFNMKRLNLDIKTISGETVAASDKIYVIDIPEEEYNYRN